MSNFKKSPGTELDKVFVYGTLQQGFANYGIIAPYCQTIRPARLQGVLYDLPFGYPAAIDGAGVITGEVVTLCPVGPALLVLDKLEDYYGPGCADNVYNRVVREVILTGGERVAAYVYLWSKPQELAMLGVINRQGKWKGNPGQTPH